jgi:hypothetical protein
MQKKCGVSLRRGGAADWKRSSRPQAARAIRRGARADCILTKGKLLLDFTKDISPRGKMGCASRTRSIGRRSALPEKNASDPEDYAKKALDL